jgi:hypothetical protein
MFDSPERQEKLYNPTKESLGRALRRVRLLDTTVSMTRRGEDIARWGPDSHDQYEATESNRFPGIGYAWLNEGRVVFITKGGKLGMAADTIQPGDVIALLLGGDLPFVLRRIEGSNHYTYVADCYVHGYMDGEGLSRPERRRIRHGSEATRLGQKSCTTATYRFCRGVSHPLMQRLPTCCVGSSTDSN